MTRITTKEAAQRLNMSVLAVQMLLREGRLPIGYALKNPNRKRYFFIIYDELVDEYIKNVESGILQAVDK